MGAVTGVITAVSAVILALTGLVAAVKGLIPLLRESQKQTRAIGEVHALVNNQLDRQLDRNEKLTRTLTAAGVAVPPSNPDPGTGLTS
jgi:sensor domain CHASE-containing protein